jgi:hypothetical protein
MEFSNPDIVVQRGGIVKKSLIGGGILVILVIGTCISLGVLFIGGIFALTRPVVDASEQFLTLLGQGMTAEAYASAADGLRAQQDEASFTAAVKRLGLTEYSSVSWYNREINNQEGIAEGTVTAKSGGTKAVAVQLVKEGGKWKVVGLRFGGVDLVAVRSPLAVPAHAELEQIVTRTLLDFNQAVQTRDFTDFYGKLSEVWKKQTTPEKLQNIFQEFIDENVDISFINGFSPQFAPSTAVNEKRVLVVAGSYPAEPSGVTFELKYIHERDGWKLLGISVNVGHDELPVASE